MGLVLFVAGCVGVARVVHKITKENGGFQQEPDNLDPEVTCFSHSYPKTDVEMKIESGTADSQANQCPYPDTEITRAATHPIPDAVRDGNFEPQLPLNQTAAPFV